MEVLSVLSGAATPPARGASTAAAGPDAPAPRTGVPSAGGRFL
ncbi:hypothetical protein [Kocuria rosea]|nr:hypothetical protein [Kocuria rosea]